MKRDLQPGWEGRRARGRLGNSHLQTTWQEVHQGSTCSNPLHDSHCYCQELCRNKSIRVGCLHPLPESLESPHLPPMPNLAPPGHHFVTEIATLYPNHIFSRDLPGSTKEIKQDVSNHPWWICLLAKGIMRHGKEYEACCCLGRQDFRSTRSRPPDSGLCHVQEWQIFITYLPDSAELWPLLQG